MSKWERRADFELRRKSLQAQIEQNRLARRELKFSMFNGVIIFIVSSLLAMIAFNELTFGVQSQKEENALMYIELHASGTIAEDVRKFDKYIVKYDGIIYPFWMKNLKNLNKDTKDFRKKLQDVINKVALKSAALAVTSPDTPGAIVRLARFYDLVAQCSDANICDSELIDTAFRDQVYDFWGRARFAVICERDRFRNLGKKLEIYVRKVSRSPFATKASNCDEIRKINDEIVSKAAKKGPQI